MFGRFRSPLRRRAGAAERGIKHICWDGCMFDNAVLEAAATWNAILKAMIEVDQAL